MFQLQNLSLFVIVAAYALTGVIAHSLKPAFSSGRDRERGRTH